MADCIKVNEVGGIVPVLDVAIPVIEELVSHGYAKVRTGVQPKAIGLMLDLECFMRRFYLFFDAEVIMKDKNGKERELAFLKRRRKKGVEHKLLQIELDERINFISDEEAKKNYVHTTILKKKDSQKKMSVNASNSTLKFQERSLAERIRYSGFNISGAVQKIKLNFSHNNFPVFPVNTFYQDFGPLGVFTKPKARIIGRHYPVSTFEKHELDEKVWQYLQNPIFWNFQGHFIAKTFDLILNQVSIGQFAEQYKQKPQKLERQIKKAKEFCYKLIEYEANNKNLSHLCKEFGCPSYLESLFLKKPLKTLTYYANPDVFEKPNSDTFGLLERLVKSYNQGQMKRKTITAEELCLRKRFNRQKNLQEELIGA